MYSDALLPADQKKKRIFLSYDRVLDRGSIEELKDHLEKTLNIFVDLHVAGPTGTGLGPRSHPCAIKHRRLDT